MSSYLKSSSAKSRLALSAATPLSCTVAPSPLISSAGGGAQRTGSSPLLRGPFEQNSVLYTKFCARGSATQWNSEKAIEVFSAEMDSAAPFGSGGRSRMQRGVRSAYRARQSRPRMPRLTKLRLSATGKSAYRSSSPREGSPSYR